MKNPNAIEVLFARSFFSLSSAQTLYYDNPEKHKQDLLSSMADLMINISNICSLLKINDDDLTKEINRLMEDYIKQAQKEI